MLRLVRFPALGDAESQLLTPWLQSVRPLSWRVPEPSAVIAPTPAGARALKAAHVLDDAGARALNLNFWSLSDAERAVIPPDGTLEAPLAELLLASCAAARPARACEAIAMNPAPLARWLADAAQAGVPFPPPDIGSLTAEIARAAAAQWKAAGRALRGERWHTALHEPPAGPRLGHILLIGFHAAHAASLPLLQLIATRARACTLCLAEPRDAGDPAETAWFASWEAAAGTEADPTAGTVARPRPNAEFAERLDVRAEAPMPGTLDAPGVRLHIARDAAAEGRAAAWQVARWLATAGAGERIAILVPGPGALAAAAARELTRLGIAYYDDIAHTVPGPGSTGAWRAWLALQATPSRDTLAEFADQCPEIDAAALLGDFDRQQERCPLPGLRAFAARPSSRMSPGLAWLHRLVWLDDSATVADHASRTADALSALGWRERAAEVRRMTHPLGQLSIPVPRTAWLRWLESGSDDFTRTRAPGAGEHFARVRLMRHDDATPLCPDRVVLCGLVEGEWPPVESASGFGSDPTRDRLNHDALRDSPDGAGVRVLAPGRAWLPGAADRRRAALRQLTDLVENAREVTFSTRLPGGGGAQSAGPSVFFLRACHARTGKVPGDADLQVLALESDAWLAASGPGAEVCPPAPEVSVGAVFRRRRDASLPFGPHEFALNKPPQEPIGIGASDWDRFVTQPATLWLAALLGIRARRPSGEDISHKVRGTLAHRWLARALRECPSNEAAGIREAAAAAREAMESALAPHPVPLAWESVRRAAFADALDLLREFQSGHHPEAGSGIFPEHTLPDGVLWKSPSGEHLPVRGRVDLLVAPCDAEGPDWNAAACALFDFKTGSSAAIEFTKGRGLQLGIYALALEVLGAAAVRLQLITPNGPLPAEPRTLADVHASDGVWSGLAHAASTGVFGMLEALRDEHAYTPALPIATTRIPADVLRAKWDLTHPGVPVSRG